MRLSPTKRNMQQGGWVWSSGVWHGKTWNWPQLWAGRVWRSSDNTRFPKSKYFSTVSYKQYTKISVWCPCIFSADEIDYSYRYSLMCILDNYDDMTVISRRTIKLLSCKQLVRTRTNYVPQDMLFGLQRDCRWAQWWLPTRDATNSRGSLWCIESHIARNLGSSSSWTWANSSWHIFTFGCSILLFKRSRSANCNCFTLLPASATTTTGLDGVSASIVPLKAVKIQTATMRSIGIRLRGQSTNPPEMGARIWAFGATPAIAPVAPSASSGWKLVMKVGSQTDKLGFSSALWTNHELLNQNSPIQDSTDAKYRMQPVWTRPSRKIRMGIRSPKSNCDTANCYPGIEFDVPWGQASQSKVGTLWSTED